MKPKFYGWLYAGLAMLLTAGGTNAQTRVPTVDLKYEIEAARKLMEKERRVVLAGEMNLTDSERRPFWDLYADYAQDMQAVSEERARQITLYADNFDAMTDEVARELLDSYFRVERERLKTREKYRKRFARVLPVIKVARFYQVENKLDAIYNFQLTSRIPVIEAGRPAGN